MGIFQARKQKKVKSQYLSDLKRYVDSLESWAHRTNAFEEALGLARQGGVTDGISLRLNRGESAFLVLRPVSLVEPRRLPGQWVGRHQGVSVRIARGVWYRAGASKGTYQQGEDVSTPIDVGAVTITNQRVVFAGTKQVREWAFSKLIGYQHEGSTTTVMQVSNRQKVSGVKYTEDVVDTFRYRLEVALAWEDGDASEVIPILEKAIAELNQRKPIAPRIPEGVKIEPESSSIEG